MISTESFEKLNTALSRDEYIKRINSFLKKRGCKEQYSKHNKNLHHFLTSNGGSIEKATKWMKEADSLGCPIKNNPSSGIYQFAEFLLKYIESKKQ